MWFIGVEVEEETSAPHPKKILDPPLKTPVQVKIQEIGRPFPIALVKS